jgi:CHAT domain-containing protein
MRPTLLFLLAIATQALGQTQVDRTRAREIDYTQYDQLTNELYTAADKVKTCQRLLDLTTELFTPEDEEYFSAYNNAGTLSEFTLLDFTAAMKQYQLAIEAYERHYPFVNRGYASINEETPLYTYLALARVYNRLNLFDKSIQYVQTHHTLLEQGSVGLKQEYYRVIGESFVGAGRYQEAIDNGVKLKEVIESGALAYTMPSADELFKIDPSYPAETQDQLKKAKAVYEKTAKASGEAMLTSQRMAYGLMLSQAYFRQYQYQEALPYCASWLKGYTRQLQSAEQMMKDQMELYAQPGGQNADYRKSYEQTIAYYQFLSELGGTSTHYIIAAVKSNLPDSAKANTFGVMDKAIYHQLTKNYAEAEKFYQAGFNKMKTLTEPTQTQFLSGYAPYYINLQVMAGNFEKAYSEMMGIMTQEEASLKKSFQFFSEGEKKEFFKNYNQILDRYYSLLMVMIDRKNDRKGEMLDKVLQTKGIILDATREQEKRIRKIKDKAVVAQIRKVRELRDKLATYYQIQSNSPNAALKDSIARISVKVNEMERRVNEKLGDSPDILKPVNWKDIQKKLKNGEVYLEIVRITRDNFSFDKPITQYWAFAIKPGAGEPDLFQLSEGESMDGRSLKNYQNRIRGRLDDNDSFEAYWAKIDSKIPGAKNILISADGAYHMINPLTLKNPKTGRYLLNEITLTRISTGRDLLTESEPSTASKEIALISNPTFDMSRRGATNVALEKEVDHAFAEATSTRGGFAMLPGTKKESDIIQALANQSGIKSKSLEGTSASESNVKSLAGPYILHFATHGEFDHLSKVDSYLKSKLILAGADDKEPFSLSDYGKFEDGFLTAYEVTQMDLANNELVVLSACETGLGEIQSGEGVWGLQRAFQLAGAKKVMGSLWKISDEATVTFMESFYKNYLSGSGLSTAYKGAMEATLAKYPHPYFWGAFTLTGKN